MLRTVVVVLRAELAAIDQLLRTKTNFLIQAAFVSFLYGVRGGSNDSCATGKKMTYY
jgi:hypothetical protein